MLSATEYVVPCRSGAGVSQLVLPVAFLTP